MATPKLGVLGQSAPAAATNATVYTVPSGRRAATSSMVVAETNGSPTPVRIFVRIGGATAGVGNAVAYDLPIDPNSHEGLTEGWTLAAGDIVTVYSLSGHVTFTLFGEETDVPTT